MKKLIPLFLLLLLIKANGQMKPLQTLKGTVSDKTLKTAMAAASIELMGEIHRIVISNQEGSFKFELLPVGRYTVKISYVGYKTITLPNIALESGKETNLLVEMEEDININQEVIVQSGPNKSRALNDAALVSSRMFSVEETRRYAAGLNDPSRMATSFPGVAGSGDKNALSIRGNAPNGLLWRMEGVDIPNPNHFARVGTSGGGISILSAQLLANSDFMTGAFPSEYGNALSGVFDIHLRKGNKDKQEHTFSASTVGVDLASEGYIKKGGKASYLVNYRYGFLTLMEQLGFKISDASTRYQDLSFNIDLPTKSAGTFSFFGFGGLSHQNRIAVNDSITFTKEPSKRSGTLDLSNTGAIGVVHSILLGKATLLKTILSFNGTNYQEEDNHYDKINGPLIVTRNNQFKESNAIIQITASHKFDKHHSLKIGVNTTSKHFSLYQREAVSNVLKDKVKEEGNAQLSQYFIQWKWDPSNKLRLQVGLHGQYFGLNQSSVMEPRMGLRLQTARNQFLSVGYGLHSQIQPLGNYFARIKVGIDTSKPNMGLDFSKAHHFVLGYSVQFAPNWNLKLETYYQTLFNIPVSALAKTSFSLINQEDDYAIEPLNNKGEGKNYGVEISLERYWNDQFYLLSSLSLYQSKYLPSDMIWRNTRFNSNSIFALATGKEWNLHAKKTSTISIDLKLSYYGGVRVTPINLAQSIIKKTTVLDNTRIYEEKLPALFRIDLQTEWKIQYRKMTGSFIAGVQNLTNRKNPVSQTYDPAIGGIRYNYLLGLIPVVGYKIDF
ncbi:MAG: carboxypeptidase regulatory-like domain-containing protein [Bacteroidetes bacterium]|nr:carboxypeptidase regulatory-like domain-containing protein [Bacteroidota bacterium]